MLSTSPKFPQTPVITYGKVSVGYNLYTGPSDDLVKIYESSVETFIKRIRLMPLGTNVETVVRIFISNSSNEYSLIHEEYMPATVQGVIALPYKDIEIATPYSKNTTIWAATSTSLAAGINVICFGEQY